MQFFITMVVGAVLLFVPGGDMLIPVTIGVSIFIGHLRNKRERSKRP